MSGTLYIVATPIGNLGDITARALETLRAVDIIACENPLHHLKLLNHFGIKKRLLEYSPANEENSAKGLVKLLLDGQNIALVTDAGVPGVSDPGKSLVSCAVEAGITVVPVPGPSALTTIASVFAKSPKRIVFLGFLPKSETKMGRELALFREIDCTLVCFASQHQAKKFLGAVNKVLGNVDVIIGREMTKANEEFLRGKVSDILERDFEERGEFTVAVEIRSES
jgi:16S rRNA (cytidine1402-2'-O)-methyltransferase